MKSVYGRKTTFFTYEPSMTTFTKSDSTFFDLIVIETFIALILAAINWNSDTRTNQKPYSYQNKTKLKVWMK
jgi:molybdopterin-guanine dinucleotide biosynthesis protein